MLLRDLLPGDARYDARFGAFDIVGLTADSRAVKPGSLFAAVPGTKMDGLSFVPQAIAAGAVAVMAERRPAAPLPEGVAFAEVADMRRALALTAANFYPRQPAVIAAVTGTSGKTSVAAFTRQIWAALGVKAASIGTIGVVTPTRETYGALTTPDPIELHRLVDGLAGEGITHLAIEASSHGLDQHRLDGLRVGIASFTNLSRDHLDYHATLEAYLAAKLILFERLVAADGTAVIEVDHDFATEVVDAARRRGLRVIDVGRAARGIRIVDCTVEGFSQTLTIAHEGREYRVKLAAGRCFPGGECAGGSWSSDCGRLRTGAGVRRARRSSRCQRPARLRRTEGRSADLRRLRPQARCPRQGA